MDIQFTKNISELNSNVEKHSSPRRRRWDRWLYIIILIVIIGSFLKWLIYPYFFDLSEGVLLQHQYDINFAEDIRIQRYYIEEGQEVKIGDTLFVYESQDRILNTNYQDSTMSLLNQDKNQVSLIDLDAQIEKRRLFIWEHKKRLDYWKKEKQRKEQLVYLNSITPNELANVDRSIDDVASEISSLQIEYRVLLNQRDKIYNHIRETVNQEQMDNKLAAKSYFVSPVEGKLDRLRGPLHEITYKKDIIASVIRPQYFVRAYIDIDKFNDFKIGDRVSVILPYQHRTLEGVVDKINKISEYKDPNLFDDVLNKKLGLVMDIVPLEKDEKEWAELGVSSMPVKIRKFKIQF